MSTHHSIHSIQHPIYYIKVGHILPFMVLKSRTGRKPGSKPDRDSYLVKIMESQLLATLPRQLAIKNYYNGATGLAAIQKIKGSRIILSQKSPFYIRKVLEHLLADALKEHKLKIKHIGAFKDTQHYKVAVESLSDSIVTNRDLYRALKPYLAKIDLAGYFGKTLFSFIKYSRDIKEFVINALFPSASPDMFYEVNYDKELEKVSILVDNDVVDSDVDSDVGSDVDSDVDSDKAGIILWAGAAEVILAQKLCGVEIEIKKINRVKKISSEDKDFWE